MCYLTLTVARGAIQFGKLAVDVQTPELRVQRLRCWGEDLHLGSDRLRKKMSKRTVFATIPMAFPYISMATGVAMILLAVLMKNRGIDLLAKT